MSALHINYFLLGADSVNDAKSFSTKAQHRLHDASFNLPKFESKSIDLDSTVNSQIPINDFTKLLRLLWNKKDDQFIFN